MRTRTCWTFLPFAGLLTVILIGLIVENFIFCTSKPPRCKWGMYRLHARSLV
jgi:hypothetical protein